MTAFATETATDDRDPAREPSAAQRHARRRSGSAGAPRLAGGICAAVLMFACWHAAAACAAGPVPQLGRREVLRLVSGVVRVEVPGSARFTRLLGTVAVPDGTQVDATDGYVRVVVATVRKGVTRSAVAWAGQFALHQERAAPYTTELKLSGSLSGCGAQALAPTAGELLAAAAAAPSKTATKPTLRRLWVSDTGGNWDTQGSYAAAIALGTRWLTEDTCTSTLVRVVQGIVRVDDFVLRRTVIRSAGQQYVARRGPGQSIRFTTTVPYPGYVGTTYDVAADGGSDDPVTFTIDPSSTPGACMYARDAVSFTGAGTCVIDANEAGAALRQQTVTVALIPQKITVLPPGDTVGFVGTTYAPVASGGGSGNAVTISIDPGSTAGACGYIDGAVSFLAPGTCVIDANQAGDAQYSAAPQVKQTVTVSVDTTYYSQMITLSPPLPGTADVGGTYAPTATTNDGTGDSGYPVVLSATGACTSANDVVTFTGLGACTIEANQAGTGDDVDPEDCDEALDIQYVYCAASTITQEVTVSDTD